MQSRWKRSFLFCFLLLFTVGCMKSVNMPRISFLPFVDRYKADIRWTEYGIPHIVADDYGSLAFGLGYACASQNLLILADQFLKVRSERARYFGAGEQDRHINSDFAYKSLNLYKIAQDSFGDLPTDVKNLLRGYAAGYNKYLREHPSPDIPEGFPDNGWIKEINEIDVMAYGLNLGQIASSYKFVDAIALAQPPLIGDILTLADDPQIHGSLPASNGWAIGKRKSKNGQGLLMANPHYPWDGELRFYEAQMTIPGEYNVSGVCLLGTPIIGLGFNENLAWTHTVSSAHRFTLYRLTLVEGDPTSYLYEGLPKKMEEETFVIKVLNDDGKLEERERTLYRTHYGPLVQSVGIAWDTELAFTIRDANVANVGLFEQWLAMGKAKNRYQLLEALQKVQGIPWVNTIYVDADGVAGYIDSSPVPNLSEASTSAFQKAVEIDPHLHYMWQRGIVILDGSRSDTEWIDEGTRIKGVVPFDRAPKLERTDFTQNCNGTPWLTNPYQPIEGYPLLYGPEKEAQSLRTRSSLSYLLDSRKHAIGDERGRFSMDDLWTIIFENRSYTADLLLDDLIEKIETQPSQQLANGKYLDLTPALEVLKSWDHKFSTESKGAHVFREFVSSFRAGKRFLQEDLFWIPFSVEDPLHTPRGLGSPQANGEDLVRKSFAEAVDRVERAGLPVYASLGDVQYVRRGEEEIPLAGGDEFDGVLNIACFSDLGRGSTALPVTEPYKVLNPVSGLGMEGYLVNYGTSYLMTVEYGPNGPNARAVLAYSQSSDPNHPNFNDQISLITQGNWREVLQSEEQILADPKLRLQTVSGS
ncbi:MAG: hypothetical protein CMO81_11340 [Waddliaceae bacterium]|nr:hypothetical protein [Waddliaceae bacterium]